MHLVLVARHPYGGHPPLGDWQMARALAEYVPVLYVDPPVFSVRDAGAAWADPRRHTTVVDEQLSVLRPWATPRADNPLAAPVNDVVFERQVEAASRAVADGRPVLVTFDPRRGTLRRVERDALVYWRRDRLSALRGVRHTTALARRDEQLVRSADLVAAPTTGLVEDAHTRGTPGVHVPNGCDVAHFSAPRSRPAALPDDGPVVGFAGGAPWRIDTALVDALARARPDWRVVLLGCRDWDGPTLPDNVTLVDYRPYAEVPAWLQGFDVGIVPYDTSLTFNRDSFPLKAFEYLAAGRPVVSTSLPALAGLAPQVTLADTPGEFADAVDRALEHGPAPDDCRALAAGNSWDQRARRLLGQLGAVELGPSQGVASAPGVTDRQQPRRRGCASRPAE